MSNILLLDRNIDEAERISSYFEARSYAVIWPKTIADLLYHVVHRDFCLAILDVALSAEDDHRFLDALRKVKGVPILVLGSDTAMRKNASILCGQVRTHICVGRIRWKNALRKRKPSYRRIRHTCKHGKRKIAHAK